ncbi:MAG: hypothetical protein ABR599_09325 [Gemmatimonadota bacterium]
MRDVEIRAFLEAEGFRSTEALAAGRAVLEAEGLTRAGKLRIAEEKLSAAREALAERLLRACADADCRRLARDAVAGGRELVRVEERDCPVCGGSNNRRATAALAERLAHRRIHRLLVVGGSAAQHRELAEALARRGVELRAVDGTLGSRSRHDARPDLEWAQLLVVWGATALPHKVSRLYTDDPPRGLPVVPLARRGVEALCREVLRSLE